MTEDEKESLVMIAVLTAFGLVVAGVIYLWR
jgi:hypothetical protein